MWEQALTYIQTYNLSEEQAKYVLAITAVGGAIALGISMYLIQVAYKKLTGKIMAKLRERLSKEVCIIIEDKFVDGLSEALAAKRIDINDARILYARLAHLGFWGLHPRKFVPKKTALDLALLKEDLKAKRAARTNSNGKTFASSVDKLLDGLAAELG